MDKIARLRQEIDKRYAEYRAKMKTDDFTYYEGMADALDLFEQYLDTLSEESDKSLEEEVKNYFQGYWPGTDTAEQCNTDLHFTPPAIIRIARHFAEWQKQQFEKNYKEIFNDYWTRGFEEGRADMKEQMLKEAVEGYVNYYEDSGGILIAEAQVGCPYHNGDKVRIVVLKEEE